MPTASKKPVNSGLQQSGSSSIPLNPASLNPAQAASIQPNAVPQLGGQYQGGQATSLHQPIPNVGLSQTAQSAIPFNLAALNPLRSMVPQPNGPPQLAQLPTGIGMQSMSMAPTFDPYAIAGGQANPYGGPPHLQSMPSAPTFTPSLPLPGSQSNPFPAQNRTNLPLGLIHPLASRGWRRTVPF